MKIKTQKQGRFAGNTLAGNHPSMASQLLSLREAAMRAAQAATMTETCTRVRTTRVADGAGSFTDGATTTAALACRVASAGMPQEYMQMAVARARRPIMITVPFGSDVLHTDTITYGGKTHEILGFVSAGQWATALRCACVEVS